MAKVVKHLTLTKLSSGVRRLLGIAKPGRSDESAYRRYLDKKYGR